MSSPQSGLLSVERAQQALSFGKGQTQHLFSLLDSCPGSWPEITKCPVDVMVAFLEAVLFKIADF